MRVFMTGGTGFVGSMLTKSLVKKGHGVTLLTRKIKKDRPVPHGISMVEGDPTEPGAWQEKVPDHEILINLAGASIFRRWSEAEKRLIRDSRIQTTTHLVKALEDRKDAKTTLLSTSAVGYYGFHGDEELNEDSPAGTDFLATVAREWEAAAMGAKTLGARVVLCRFGIVLGSGGGALSEMVPLFQKGLGSPLGSGDQWFSWIHQMDLVRIFLFLLEREDLSGPFNCTAPEPVRNRVLTKALGTVLDKPTFMPSVPGFVIRMVKGEFGNVLLKGQRVMPEKLLKAGFQFQYPNISGALRNLLHPPPDNCTLHPVNFYKKDIAMTNHPFKAYVVEENEDGSFSGDLKERTIDQLPPGEVTVRVEYSSLNYKDALSATGNRGVTKAYPHTPGIDAAGIVEVSRVEGIPEETPVIVTSYDLGMNTPGGFGRYIRVPATWVVPLPSGLSLKESMIFGTAGFTAALSLLKLTEAVKPEQGPIVVTGATGGVGSVAAAILAKLGYAVSAVSGKATAKDFLEPLGVKNVIERTAFLKDTDRPLLKPIWAGAVDTVGGELLATAIKSTQPLGVVTCCGNAASAQLPITVFPFILRGVSLMGVNSQSCPMEIRKKAWEKLSNEWKFDGLKQICREISLSGLGDKIETILKGGLTGRTVIRLHETADTA